MDETEERWADLPKELLETLFTSFVGIDNLRVRAVCTSWRSSIPPSQKQNFQSYILPFPVNLADNGPTITGASYFELTESTVFCLEPSDENLDSSSSARNHWLVKVEESSKGTLKILNPLSERRVHRKRSPKVINLLEIRTTQVCKAYNLQLVNPSIRFCPYFIQNYAKKVVVLPSPCSSSLGEAVAIDIYGQLWHAKSGDKTWTQLSKGNSSFVDLLNHMDGFYVTEKKGKTVMYDSTFKEAMVSSSIESDGCRKHLVNSSETGELFLIDIILDIDRRRNIRSQTGGYNGPHEPAQSPYYHTAIEIKIYKLNEEKHEWEEVKNLDDRVVFAGEDCSYMISNVKVSGFKDNCVYFTDRHYFKDVGSDDELVEVLLGHNIGVFDLESGKLGPLSLFREYAPLFWPPPGWLRRSV
ncbi:F-box protein SKIP23-like [Impatiens glandulifera]|uniref:F-box protein SKIP23-like n=1 Tax=Impatiens glandulifera TaxID=253017 RepID=UPI001FB14483|nr:F-box protein SKIP23-like [Impatiens glandulifera]